MATSVGLRDWNEPSGRIQQRIRYACLICVIFGDVDRRDAPVEVMAFGAA
jgi:hypothetical protein